MTNSAIFPMVAANLITTGCALLLVRRGPSPRLRLLTLSVGLLALSQNAHFLYSQGIWSGGDLYFRQLHHSLVAGLSLLAIYLLGSEIHDRNLTDRKLRLAEHEIPHAGAQPAPVTLSPARHSKLLNGATAAAASAGSQQAHATESSSILGLLNLAQHTHSSGMVSLNATTLDAEDSQPAANVAERVPLAPPCPECLELVRRIVISGECPHSTAGVSSPDPTFETKSSP